MGKSREETKGEKMKSEEIKQFIKKLFGEKVNILNGTIQYGARGTPHKTITIKFLKKGNKDKIKKLEEIGFNIKFGLFSPYVSEVGRPLKCKAYIECEETKRKK